MYIVWAGIGTALIVYYGYLTVDSLGKLDKKEKESVLYKNPLWFLQKDVIKEEFRGGVRRKMLIVQILILMYLAASFLFVW